MPECTTIRYITVATRAIAAVKSPLDHLRLAVPEMCKPGDGHGRATSNMLGGQPERLSREEFPGAQREWGA